MSTKIVIDIETQKSFSEVGGKSNLDLLGISVAGIYDYGRDKFQAYTEAELGVVEELLERAELVIGFNNRQFDLPVLKPYLKKVNIMDLEQLDIMEQLQEILGYRVSLDSVAGATLGINKSGHGLQAIEDFRRGEIEKIKAYCLDDVKITRDIYEFGLKNGYLKFKAAWNIYDAPVKFK